jgi:adenine deaminase
MNSTVTTLPGVDMTAFIRGLPKAELHIHIEGSLEPELVFALAARHDVALPYPSVAALRRAYDFHNLQSFLDIYYAGANVLRVEDDFLEMTWEYLVRARADGVVHTEIFFDPQTHTQRGIAFGTVMAGITRALAQGEREFGITSRLIMCFLRHLPADDAMRTLREALPWKAAIHGVGLDSSEVGHPPSNFADVFRAAREAGFRAVAHAGEEGPPSYIREALDLLHVERIDHGVRCESDDALCLRLAAEHMPLTVCPLSNVKLGVFPNMAQHNLKRLLDRGLNVTVNSDDPAYFGGYIVDNYVAAQKALGLTRDDVVALARNSFAASFLPEEQKAAWIATVDAYAQAH